MKMFSSYSNIHAKRVGACILSAAMLTIVACARVSAQPQPSGDIYQRSTLRLSKPPEQAAACLVEHARSAGRSAEVVPLYGVESVAVTIRTSSTGDVHAVLSLMRAEAGTNAAVTTFKDGIADRADFMSQLIQGC
ncbi:MAG: hypothetical protein JWM26_2093 [Betaproteobacteria bacterium]|nr:hypothetical protein [Betaproteobacteria bacterium]